MPEIVYPILWSLAGMVLSFAAGVQWVRVSVERRHAREMEVVEIAFRGVDERLSKLERKEGGI